MTTHNDENRKQPQQVMTYQQFQAQLTNVIHTLENADSDPDISQAIQQLRTLTEQMKTARVA